MSKLFALWQNETIKIFRRVSTLILIILVALSPFAVGGMIKLTERIEDTVYNYDGLDGEEIDQSIKETEDRISELETEIAALDPERADGKYSELSYAYKDLFTLRLQKQYDLDSNIPNYKNDIIDSLSSIRTMQKVPQVTETGRFITEGADLAARDAVLENILKSGSYKDYIELRREIINSGNYSDEEKKLYNESLDLYLAADPDGLDAGYELPSAIDRVESYKLQLIRGVYLADEGNELPLAAEQRTEIENRIAVESYKLKNGYVKPAESMSMLGSEVGLYADNAVGLFCAAVLMLVIILAGSTVSSEMSSGSIKSLIISPTRRWKIFTAKLVAIITAALVAAAVGYVFTLCAGYILFGREAFSPYVYASAGVAHAMSGPIYLALLTLVNLIPVIVTAAFALMLSTVTRNTAASVGISVAAYFGGSIVMSVLKIMGFEGEWIKFLPFTNMNGLDDKFFPFNAMGDTVASVGVNVFEPSLMFSVIYLVVLFGLMVYTAFDSFTRRDI